MKKYQIRNRWTGEVITESNKSILDAVNSTNNLTGADLTGANLTNAYLTGADLARANLTDADLTRAVLARAVLTRANLTNAYLTDAVLTRAIGINKYLSTALTFLYDQPGKIRAYKLVGENYESPIRPDGKITYGIGEVFSVDKWDSDEFRDCGAGINLATMDWCLRWWERGRRVLIAEFTADDIVAIPVATEGKFRVKRCKIVGEVDLREIVPEWFKNT